MKIICIGRNYAKHAKELNNALPTEPIFFFKTETSLLPKKQAFFIPDFSNEIHFEAELVVRINRLGKNIQEKFAHKYYNEIGFGIDFTARDLQDECKKKSLPWEKAKAFDGSAPIGYKFIEKSKLKDVNNINFSLRINGEERQNGQSNDMIFSFDQIIAYVSQFVTLKIGDLIFTGTPEGVGKINIDDFLEGFIENEKVFELKIK